MPKTLYLMRHGQTLFNTRKVIQGWCDSPLTPEGIRQASYAKQYFADKGITFDAAYASTQERASDTLELVTDMPYTRVKGIKEMHFGIYEGHSEALHQPRAHPDQRSFQDEYVKFGGESYDQVETRVTQALTQMMETEGHNTVLAVSHAAACYFFTLKHYPQVSLDQVKFTNCCILKWTYETGQFSFVEAVDHDFTQPLA